VDECKPLVDGLFYSDNFNIHELYRTLVGWAWNKPKAGAYTRPLFCST